MMKFSLLRQQVNEHLWLKILSNKAASPRSLVYKYCNIYIYKIYTGEVNTLVSMEGSSVITVYF
jgi:hypothetical protein